MAWFSFVADVVGIVSFLFLVYQQIQIYRLRRELKERGRQLAAVRQRGRLVLNMSGHPMHPDQAEGGWLDGCQVLNVPTGFVDMNRPHEGAVQLLSRLDPEVLAALAHGDAVVVALPGATALAAHLLAVIHGVAGSFPFLTWAVREGDRILWKQPVDLHALRTASRERRMQS